ncbi:hypothetical protein, partial [Streptococcus pneumoniae]|uniref:hypothetical protein n=1 Tax=Streptococcus pneumoniae TaxID=1313 RepID=UPI0012D81588
MATEDIKHEDVGPVVNPKAALTEKAFNQAIGRIKAGEKELVEKITASYTLTDMQMKAIEEALIAPAI